MQLVKLLREQLLLRLHRGLALLLHSLAMQRRPHLAGRSHPRRSLLPGSVPDRSRGVQAEDEAQEPDAGDQLRQARDVPLMLAVEECSRSFRREGCRPSLPFIDPAVPAIIIENYVNHQFA